jgi:uncharacterized protein (UPF0548 family)
MFLSRKPDAETVRQFILSQQALPFSYREVGATRDETPPQNFTADHNRTRLGEGEKVYQRAVAALKRWEQFNLGWVTIVPTDTPIAVGQGVAVRAYTFGFWSLSATRIVYLIEEPGPPVQRFGFAYGTLPNHVECGEERFTIERLEDDSVWYDIYAFSRPQQALARLASPITRTLQKRFIRESLAIMKKAAAD